MLISSLRRVSTICPVRRRSITVHTPDPNDVDVFTRDPKAYEIAGRRFMQAGAWGLDAAITLNKITPAEYERIGQEAERQMRGDRSAVIILPLSVTFERPPTADDFFSDKWWKDKARLEQQDQCAPTRADKALFRDLLVAVAVPAAIVLALTPMLFSMSL